MVFNHTLTKSSSFSRLKYYVYVLQLYVYMSYICKRHVDVYICTCIYFTFVGAMYMYVLHLYVYIFYIVSAMYICVAHDLCICLSFLVCCDRELFRHCTQFSSLKLFPVYVQVFTQVFLVVIVMDSHDVVCIFLIYLWWRHMLVNEVVDWW